MIDSWQHHLITCFCLASMIGWRNFSTTWWIINWHSTVFLASSHNHSCIVNAAWTANVHVTMGDLLTRFTLLLMLIIDCSSTTAYRGGKYTKYCRDISFNALSFKLRESHALSRKDCIYQCVDHYRCCALTFNGATVDENNCILYSDETVSCILGNSDVTITIKVVYRVTLYKF